ncbi:glutathione S-transferase [Sorangium cellulosum]|uniref:Glutathione S-transferase n=1 Tax=Sorangium cellulosum TaxID=56 RepID=A0A2L0F2F6_SORCE|nr:glutathione S-transferase family protein [Sorangium cellulosum]AUX45681.1 glutathione S-transferase [Sorangium cellulosum]
MTSIRLYDLQVRDDRRPSPFCWRAKYALAHKGLPFETVPVALTDIPAVAGGTHKTVPILDDGGKIVSDSWAIADYLDEVYPDRPRLFGSPAERALCQFVETSLIASAARPILLCYLKDIYDCVLDKDRDYFRQSREKFIGCTLEELASGRAERIEAARAGLESVRLTLKGGAPFLSGAHPGYADYIVAGFLLWIALVATAPLLQSDDPLLAWLARVQDLHGGVGRAVPLSAMVA